MTVEPAKLLEGLFDKKRMTLIRLFLDHPKQEYGVREAAKAARLAPATVYRIIRLLVKLEIVDERRIKKLRLYRLALTKESRFLEELLAVKKSAIEEFTERASKVAGVDALIQHGKAAKEKVSILVIGEDVDTAAVSRIVGEIKERYNFSVLTFALALAQYEQMSSMGLYTGEKHVLFRR